MSTEEALREYLAKRDLDVSGEPGGGEPGERPRVVIQRHDASSLHYDFRLEADGEVVPMAGAGRRSRQGVAGG